jgi:predicted AAA+ superfamily ATPase
MLRRAGFAYRVGQALGRSPAVAIVGPRQCGKTTLAHQVVQELAHDWFDLEDPSALRRLQAPKIALEMARGIVVLDEIQRAAELFPLLRFLIDAAPSRRFLILGSASPSLLTSASESLAGRVEFVELGGFDLGEVGADAPMQLWSRGGFPRSFLAATDADSYAWRESFIHTFLERDLPELEVKIPSTTMRRFWTMLAHYHGQIWNASELGRALGVNEKTARSYLDILGGTYMVRVLQPWYENLGKRLVRSPKAYVRDSGLLHVLLGLRSLPEVMSHPKLGASWEGFALEQVLRKVDGEPWFWATHQGAELDLLLLRRGDRVGFEFKCTDAPQLTKSMQIARHDLRLDHLYVVYPGRERYPLGDGVEAMPISGLVSFQT